MGRSAARKEAGRTLRLNHDQPRHACAINSARVGRHCRRHAGLLKNLRGRRVKRIKGFARRDCVANAG